MSSGSLDELVLLAEFASKFDALLSSESSSTTLEIRVSAAAAALLLDRLTDILASFYRQKISESQNLVKIS